MSGPALLALSVMSALGFAAFVLTETRAPAPLVRLGLLRERVLGTGLASLMLVSAIVMATLVVGPFHLGGILGLDPVGTGMVMSVGPAVAAMTGVPAGRLVDRLGSFPVIVAGLLSVMTGCLMLTALPGLFGIGGYTAGLVVVTFGYAMFQAANLTAIIQRTASDHRGVVSALVGLSRNMGCVCDGSALCRRTAPRRSHWFQRRRRQRSQLYLHRCGRRCRCCARSRAMGTKGTRACCEVI